MPARDLIEAWIVLIVLSIGTVLLTAMPKLGNTLIALGVLVLSEFKARVILARYLGLSNSRFWMRICDVAITFFLTLAFSLYVFGSGR